MLHFLFSTLAAILNLYLLVCVVAIFLSWAPGIKFTSFGKFMTAITDPYLNIFRKIKFLTIGYVDFSPIIALGVLSLTSSVFAHIANTGRIYLGGILGSIIYMIWNLVSTILIVLTIVMLIRWIVLLVNHGQTPYNSAWNQVDTFLEKISYKVSKTLARKPVKYQTSLLMSWICGACILLAGSFLIDTLLKLCGAIPF